MVLRVRQGTFFCPRGTLGVDLHAPVGTICSNVRINISLEYDKL